MTMDGDIAARLSPGARLYVSGAVAAILTTADGRYLLQLRDDKPEIWFPGLWGLFGGAMNDGEGLIDALRREVMEETGLTIADPAYFTQIAFDFTAQGSDMKYRYYYEAALGPNDVERIVLTEGQSHQLFTADEIRHRGCFTPYDHFVLQLHMVRDRIVPPAILGASASAG